MTHKRIFIVLTFILVSLTLAFQWGYAQEEAPDAPNEPLAPEAVYLGTGFTYQGKLTDSGGVPINDTCDLNFSLWNDPTITTAGAKVGVDSLITNVSVVDGHFAALVNSSNEFTSDAFFGHKRWLEIAVQCSGDPSFTTLSPRQEMNATPYAHSLRPGAEIRGNQPEGNTLSVFNFATTGQSNGLYGEASSLSGIAIYGLNTATSNLNLTSPQGGAGGIGVKGEGITGVIGSGSYLGVYGYSTDDDGRGVFGQTFSTSLDLESYGVYGEAQSSNAAGVFGKNNAATNAYLKGGPSGIGVKGEGPIGVQGTGTEIGVAGYSTDAWGVYGYSSTGQAGHFNGTVEVVGNFSVTGLKAFKIDHPLDPANQYLYHYCVESSEVLNEYSGNVILDENGEAWVEMPTWFNAVNTDFRYQLTPIGGAAPNLHIVQELQDGRFQIAGGTEDLKISWLVTALRNDPYLQENTPPVEQTKPIDERGTYLAPELYGQPTENGLDYVPAP